MCESAIVAVVVGVGVETLRENKQQELGNSSAEGSVTGLL